MANKKHMKPRALIFGCLRQGIVSPNEIYNKVIEDCFISRQQVYNILKEFEKKGYAKKECFTVKVQRLRYRPLVERLPSNLDT